MSKRGNLFVVSGFSGSGKGTVMKQLCKNEQYALSISCTSRAPRDGETNGKEYYFISHEEFVKRQAEGYFLESAIYVNKGYGTPLGFVEENLAQALLVVAQPYLFGGFSEKLISSAAYALDALKQSEDDVICRITDSDGNRDAVFLINENGSGYCFVAVSDDIIAQVGLFSFTPCDIGKELYRRMWEEINKYDTIVAQ